MVVVKIKSHPRETFKNGHPETQIGLIRGLIDHKYWRVPEGYYTFRYQVEDNNNKSKTDFYFMPLW